MSKVRKLSPRKSRAAPASAAGEVRADDPVQLPGVNQPPQRLTDYSLLIFGEKGVGKTSVASRFPDAIVFMWEPGRRNLPIRQVPDLCRLEPALTWPRFWQYASLICSQAGSKGGAKSVVIDTIDRAYEACMADYCYNVGISHPNDANDYGKTWSAITRAFETVMNQFLYAGVTPIYLSHAKLREVVTQTGSQYDLLIPSCANQPFQYLKASVDIALYYGYVQKSRAFTVRGNELIWSACGVEDHFLTPDGQPLDTFWAGDTPDQAYDLLNRTFDNQVASIFEDDPEAEQSPPTDDVALPDANESTTPSRKRRK